MTISKTRLHATLPPSLKLRRTGRRAGTAFVLFLCAATWTGSASAMRQRDTKKPKEESSLCRALASAVSFHTDPESGEEYVRFCGLCGLRIGIAEEKQKQKTE